MEETPTTEIPKYTREQVIATLRPLSQKAIMSPDDLDLSDPEVIEANRILDAWTKQGEEEAKSKGTPEAELEFNFSRSTIHVDAGFSDPDYLDEVANDWLIQDLDAMEGYGLTELAAKVEAKIAEIESKIHS